MSTSYQVLSLLVLLICFCQNVPAKSLLQDRNVPENTMFLDENIPKNTMFYDENFPVKPMLQENTKNDLQRSRQLVVFFVLKKIFLTFSFFAIFPKNLICVSIIDVFAHNMESKHVFF